MKHSERKAIEIGRIEGDFMDGLLEWCVLSAALWRYLYEPFDQISIRFVRIAKRDRQSFGQHIKRLYEFIFC